MRHLPALLLLLLLAAPTADGGLLDYIRRVVGVGIESAADPASPVANEDPPVEKAASAAEDASSKVCATADSTDGTCIDAGGGARSEEANLSAAAAREGEGADGHHCVDDNENCPKWSEAGECEKNPGYMLASCRRSCNVCQHEYDENDFGKPQSIPSGLAGPVKEIIANSVAYMQAIRSDPEYDIVREECRNKEGRCSEWAMGTGCDDNPRYMKTECGPACQSCDHILELKRKCGLDPNGKDAIEKGGLDGLFERLVWVADRSNWEPAVLSRPPKKGDSNKSCEEEDVTNPCNAAEGPWVVTLDNFLLPEEKDALLKWGAEIGYERSQAGDAVVEARTSAHAWCEGDCSTDPLVKGLKDRIAHVTGTPEENHEYLQLLKYEEGQYYRPHNDFISAHTQQAHGPRMLTFFIYLNEVEKGGGTRFPRLNGLTVEPKMGKVLIWPSVLDDDLYAEDERTEHEALPVEAGQKFGANAWIHTRDFHGPFLAGCDS